MVKMRIRDKIIGLLVLYFLIALAAIGSTLIVSWRLEGGATAINNAGRERMRSYRIAYLLEKMVQQPTEQLRVDINHEIALFEITLDELEQSDHERTLL
jgi:two-component system, NarL family, nitrate/nitrite sensor histidine kinase NarX